MLVGEQFCKWRRFGRAAFMLILKSVIPVAHFEILTWNLRGHCPVLGMRNETHIASEPAAFSVMVVDFTRQ